ncbi:MAG TPA: hypothetical protein EYH58_05260, partial [Aquifex aeolicus]|nr:hypothetical protein [Aquifex aeolicus]
MANFGKKGIYTASLAIFSFPIFAIDLAEDVKVNVELRPRYEYVDVDNSTNKEANALTIRIRTGINFKGLFNVKNLDFLFEPWVVTGIVKDYAPEKSGYEVVPDPEQVRINQAFLYYKSGLFGLKIGR